MPYKNREDRNRHEAFRTAKRKLQFITDAGGRCMDCGYDAVPEILQFHHRNNAEKTTDTTVRISAARIKDEILRCDLLCPRCHALRHLVEEEWHGRTARFLRFHGSVAPMTVPVRERKH